MILKLILSGMLSCLRPSDTQKIKCISLNNEPYLARPILIDLNPDELHCYPSMVSSDRCGRSRNILDDPSKKMFDSIKKGHQCKSISYDTRNQ